MSAPSFSIRRGEPADAERLAAFAARTFAETFGADNRPEDLASHLAQTYGTAQQRRELEDPDTVTVLMEASDGWAAYAQVRRCAAPACVSTDAPVELARFYVDRPWHGRGVSHRLMSAVFTAASSLGGRSVWLGVWERNPRAIAFYEKSGFRDVGSATFFVGGDAQTDRVLVAVLGASGEPVAGRQAPAGSANVSGSRAERSSAASRTLP